MLNVDRKMSLFVLLLVIFGKQFSTRTKQLEYLLNIYPHLILGKQIWQSQNTYRIFPDGAILQNEVGIKNIHWSTFVKKLLRLAHKKEKI